MILYVVGTEDRLRNIVFYQRTFTSGHTENCV